MKKINLLLTLALTTAIGSMNADKIDDAIAQAESEMQEIRNKAKHCPESFDYEQAGNNFSGYTCAYSLHSLWQINAQEDYVKNAIRIIILKLFQQMTEEEKRNVLHAINESPWINQSSHTEYYDWAYQILNKMHKYKNKIKLDKIITKSSIESTIERWSEAMKIAGYDVQYYLDLLKP